MKFFSDIRLLFLAIWLGAAVFFIGVAQSSFAVLPTRELAGSVVNRTLAIRANYLGGVDPDVADRLVADLAVMVVGRKVSAACDCRVVCRRSICDRLLVVIYQTPAWPSDR